MHMFCFQCQETGEGKGCRFFGACGKEAEVANLQDVLIYALKGLAVCYETLAPFGVTPDRKTDMFVAKALFSTVTNVNFDGERVLALVREALEMKAALLATHAEHFVGLDHPVAWWLPADEAELKAKGLHVGVLFCNPDEDVRSLREMVIYGLKGIAAYIYHAMILNYDDAELSRFVLKALAATTRELTVPELIGLAMETGQMTIRSMALIERANVGRYGEPQVTHVPLGVRNNPAILVSGHDLKDMEELLEQTSGSGVDIYTHSEMLAAHYYPAFKKYQHLAGNYGNAWWNQDRDFTSFNGPILVTSNCITPVQDAYRNRIFSTGPVAYPGVTHIGESDDSGHKDYSKLIELAKQCPPPTALDAGEFVGGFAHAQLDAAAPRILELVGQGKIKRFIVIGGCDGRDVSRDYYRQVAELLPQDTLILTAGCAKYRFMGVDAGAIDGVPRIIDAGQCNDCYSLVMIALKLKEALGISDINDLPISYDIPWYDQKSVAVLLALLSLGVKGLRLGPTHPAFISPTVRDFLVENYDLKRIGTPAADVAAMLSGE